MSPRPELQPAPAAVDEEGRIRYGRYAGPIPYVNFGDRKRDRLRKKEWHYTAVTTDRHFVAFAVVQLGYVANVFAYVVDRQKPDVPRTMEALLPLGRGLAFGASSVDGHTRLEHQGQRIDVRYGLEGFHVELDLDVDGARLRGAFDCLAGPSFSLVHALDASRIAYTHKASTYRVTGTLAHGDARILPAEGALGTIDWTRSIANRTTRWKWASLSTHAEDGTPLGLNLSADVYDDADGDSEENVFFDGDRVRPLGGVSFQVPRAPRTMPWHISSRQGSEVDLVFTPYGARGQVLDLGVLKSDFVQPYGVFRGRILDRAIDGAFGVVENHLSVW